MQGAASARHVADQCGVGVALVGGVCRQLSESDSSINPPTLIGKDGKERALSTTTARAECGYFLLQHFYSFAALLDVAICKKANKHRGFR